MLPVLMGVERSLKKVPGVRQSGSQSGDSVGSWCVMMKIATIEQLEAAVTQNELWCRP